MVAGRTISAYDAVSDIKCSADTKNKSSLFKPSTILSVSVACVTGLAFQHIIDLIGISECSSPKSALPIFSALITLVFFGIKSGLQITSNL